MTQYLRGVDISHYYPNQVSDLCNYFVSKGTPLDIAQVELISGSSSELTTTNNSRNPDPEIIKVIKDIKDNNLKLGYYAYLYPANSNIGFASVQAQGEAFVLAYNQVKNQLGVTPDCKIMIDIEMPAFSAANVTPSSNIGKSMVSEFVDTVNAGLGEQEYVVYSSRNGISNLFQTIDTSKYGLIVSAPSSNNSYTMEQISYPTSNPIPGYLSNWGSNWTGVQFAYGGKQDYDIFTEDFLLSNLSLKIGDYVKIVSGENFAPNLIPSTDKGVKYTIESINGSMCKLSEINEWVNFEDLSLIQSPNPPSEPIGSLAHPKGSNAHAEQIYNICKKAGWSIEAICGMLGNLSWESSLDATKHQDFGGPGYGLAQWPISHLEEYAQQAGVSDYNTIPGQMQIIIYQMNNGGGGQYFPNVNYPEFNLSESEFITSEKSPSFLAQTWLHEYERAGIADTQKRINGAEYWYAYFINQ